MCKMHHHRGYGHHHRHGHGRGHGGYGHGHRPFSVPVNVREFDDRYELHVIAPGRNREDFTLEIADDLLTIKVQQPERATDEGQWQRYEFRLGSFERSFELSDKIDADGITAAYEAGILRITLPKREDRVTQRRRLDLV